MSALLIAAAALVGLLLSLVRLLSGPTLSDRVLALNAMVLNAALIAGAAALALRRADILEGVAMLLLAALVVNVAVLKAFAARSFQPALARSAEDGA